MHYWIHVSEGVTVLTYGPFTQAQADRFRELYADDEDERGYRRPTDDLPPLPASYETRDDHESDTWIRLQVGDDGRVLVADDEPIKVQETTVFELVP